MSYRCLTCGQLHDDLPHIGSAKPDIYWDVPEEERERRIQLTTDTCILDSEHYFIRGVIEIHVHERPENFGFGAWVSQKREHFFKYQDEPDSDQIGPFFGWVCTRIAYYPGDTYLLKALAHFRGGGLRPFIELEPTDHPLAVDQQNGIDVAKAWEIVHYYEDLLKNLRR